MAITSAISGIDILNRVAAEVGLDPVSDPFSSTEQHFIQMRYLLQTCGEELCLAHPWEFLNEEHQITTTALDTGVYTLPTDFHYMIPQTGWERANNVPLAGPLNAQDWTYLLGRDLVSQTIYASFRIKEGSFHIFPQPPPAGLDINFEYQRRSWVQDPATSLYTYEITDGSYIVVFDRTLITRMLKVKWLESKGFDTTKAQDDFNQVFGFLTGKDTSGEVLSAGCGRQSIPYLDNRSVPDSGFGS